MAGTFYLVGTPIGNLADITLRAIDTLKNVDMIACEDTRHSLGLLNYYQISKPLFSCHQHNEKESCYKIARLLEEGKNIALITDAGMPAISDPGAVVVNYLNQEGYHTEVIPGPTAVASAIALSGICQPVWTFVGFLPSKNKDKALLLEQFCNTPTALVFYSSPYDINKDLQSLFKYLGNRKVHIVKEITKLHENHCQMFLEEAQIETPKGEYVIVVEQGEPIEKEAPQGDIASQVVACMQVGMTKKDAIKQVAKNNNLLKDDVYKQVIDLK